MSSTAKQAMRELEQLAQLIKMRRIATGLLGLMALLFVFSSILQKSYYYFSFVSAFAEAAMVGALADWFAITVLFRHPFGLPIPHTAIIPNNKDRIGASVGNFLEHHFMTHAVLKEELASIDFVSTAAQWLMQEKNSHVIAAQVVSVVPAFLRMMKDEDIGHFLQHAMRHSIKDIKLAPILAEVLSILIAGRQHHVLFEEILAVIAKVLEENQSYLRKKVYESSPRWMPKTIAERFFKRLLDGLREILNEMQYEENVWRERFQAFTEEWIAKLKTEPKYEEKLHAWMGKILRHPSFRNYAEQVWHDVQRQLLLDSTAPDSHLIAWLDDIMRMLSRALLQDDVIRHKLNQWMQTFFIDTIVDRRDMIANLVKGVIRKWDAETISHRFELLVGKDLQYIRINGTLVGGLVGLVLHCISLAL